MKRLLPILVAAVAVFAMISPVSTVFAADAAADEKIDLNKTLGVGFGIFSPIGDYANANEYKSMPAFLGAQLYVRYWMMDKLAFEPELQVNSYSSNSKYAATPNTPPTPISTVNNDSILSGSAKNAGSAILIIHPQLIVLYSLITTNSTRFEIGGGLGLDFGSLSKGKTATDEGADIPIEFGVEHFFTKWFSMDVGASFDLFGYDAQKIGTKTSTSAAVFNLDSTNLFLNFMVYTK
jgi:hypothetical protein